MNDYFFIDTHCHLDYLKGGSVESVIADANKALVKTIITVGVSAENQKRNLELATGFDNVFCSQGLHPHDAKDWNDELKNEIIENSKSKRVVAFGEIGLDYHYDHSPRSVQRDVFEEQLALAINLNLPIIIHSREAEDDTMAILKNYQSEIKKLIFHSYTSNRQLAEYALSQNYFLGFNGIITFPKATNVREILLMTPVERIMLETDAPFLAPIPHRGKENHPQYIPAIADKIAKEKNISIEELARVTSQTAIDFFKLT